MVELWEIGKDRDIENCLTNCPLDEQPLSPEAEEETCSKCYLNSEEYERLSDRSELFSLAMDYLQAREIGAQDPIDSYGPKERAAIMLVHQEIEQVKQREIRDQRKEAEAKEEHERLRREPI